MPHDNSRAVCYTTEDKVLAPGAEVSLLLEILRRLRFQNEISRSLETSAAILYWALLATECILFSSFARRRDSNYYRKIPLPGAFC